MAEIAFLSASEAVERFRSRELSPVELMQAVIDQAERVEPEVNALTFRFFDQAMAAAKEAEARYLGKGPDPRPLEGIPLAIKEETPVAGQPCTSGSLVYKDEVIDDETSPIIARALEAGAIPHARTTTPEFSCAGFTHSKLFGVTRNPWNPAFDVGGSSGGAAAALASGSTTLANGSDIGGSIRIPASCCGVVGFKPPYGRVPQSPPFNLDHYCHEGPLARTVADCRLFENLIAGPHPHDVASLRPKLQIPNLSGDVSGWKIALSYDLGCFEVADDVVQRTRAAADAFRDAGATVEEFELPWQHDEIMRAAFIHYGAIFGPWVQGVVADHPEEVTPYAAAFAKRATIDQPGDLLEGLEIEGRIYAALGEILERYQLLICPTLAISALEAGLDYVDGGMTPDGIELSANFDHLMTIPFNICSRAPVMSVPSGFSRHGVPTGLQIVGRTFDDVSVFEAAAAFERVRPWPQGIGQRQATEAVPS
jgi:Asp-tRNA(Asn)/Glu-tRNA(Gln) amidotransferase A subunit family amidase